MLCNLVYNRAVNLMDFCPGIFHAPGPLPCRPGMHSAEITIFPVINRRHLQIVIMDICQYLLMHPVRHSAAPVHWYINIISLANIVPAGSPSSNQQHIQLMLFVIFCLASMLDNLKPPCRKFAVRRKKHLQIVSHFISCPVLITDNSEGLCASTHSINA